MQADRDSIRGHYEHEYEEWEACRGSVHDVAPFALDVAPDSLHKMGTSGGLPYAIFVPDASADATFRFDDGVLMPFIEYLRLAFSWGGFPGFRRPDCSDVADKVRSELARDLLPL